MVDSAALYHISHRRLAWLNGLREGRVYTQVDFAGEPPLGQAIDWGVEMVQQRLAVFRSWVCGVAEAFRHAT